MSNSKNAVCGSLISGCNGLVRSAIPNGLVVRMLLFGYISDLACIFCMHGFPVEDVVQDCTAGFCCYSKEIELCDYF